MTQLELKNKIEALILQYEKETDEIVGCFLNFDHEKMGLDGILYEFNGRQFECKPNLILECKERL